MKASIVSLGCAKNTVDTEIMLGLLQKEGYTLTRQIQEAQVLIINTCGFITPAKEESIRHILNSAQLKKTGCCQVLLVAGCLAQRYGQELLNEMPEVDGLIGTGAVTEIGSIVRAALKGEKVCACPSPAYIYHSDLPRLRVTPFYTAYVKIAEGCNQHCAFCVIPLIKGSYRSRKMEDVEAEVALLINKGVKEINLIAQDTTSYGKDLYGEYCLSKLLRRLAKVTPEKVWLRLLYGHPASFTPELLTVIAEENKICRYLDLPLQHISDPMLKRMNRQKKGVDTRSLIKQIRNTMPGLTLRTTFIVGFPGETEDHFQELLAFMREACFERVGIFKYSPEEGTAAESMPDQVPGEIKEERFHRAMLLQREISYRKNKEQAGKEVTVLVEGKKNGYYYGRGEADAPEVDGQVFFTTQGKKVAVGEFRRVRILKAKNYDLIGKLSF
ncbi:ribosomal protein S12 methylthiotransferase [Peptococcaceae bacterium SCADC1_2_3]|nr:ribosomal protein S12 methylthiotransferase [Peptococcaceae bacterium SCADC1_2_3]